LKVFIEYTCPTCGILRGGPNAEKYGDPYDYIAFFRLDDDKSHALIKGLILDPSKPNFRLMMDLIQATKLAFSKEPSSPKVIWDRYNHNNPRHIG